MGRSFIAYYPAATLQKNDRIVGRAGASLTRAYLEVETDEALCRVVSGAVSLGASPRLADEVSDRDLFNQPGETMLVSGKDWY